MFFSYRGKQVYYELHGEGRPLLLLNGILMNTASWAPFITAFTRGGNRLILVDLLDQGKTEAMEVEYTIDTQAGMVAALLAELGLGRVSVMGTSYGGAVALSLAIHHPEKVGRLLLAATRARTDQLFKGLCESWLHACHSPQALYSATMPLFYGASFQEEAKEWLGRRRALLERTAFANPGFLARFQRLVRSIMAYDLTARLHEISVPALVLAPEEDLVMFPRENRLIAEGIPGAHLLTLHKTGHVMFLERPSLFIPVMMGWFNHPDTITLP